MHDNCRSPRPVRVASACAAAAAALFAVPPAAPAVWAAPPAAPAVSTPPTGRLSAEERRAVAAAVPLPQFQAEFGIFFHSSLRTGTGFALSTDEAEERERATAAYAAAPKPSGTVLVRAEGRLARARLAAQAGLDGDSEREAAAAAALFRRALRARPLKQGDAASLRAALGLADALCHIGGEGRKREADALLRRAVAVAPDAPEPWFRLGTKLTVDMFEGLSGFGNVSSGGSAGADPGAILQAVTDRVRTGTLFPDTALARVRNLSDEAARCFTRAIERDPGRPEPYIGRAVCGVWPTLLEEAATAMRHASDSRPGGAPPAAPSSASFMDRLFSARAQEDVRRAAALTPDDPVALVAPGFSTYLRLTVPGADGSTADEKGAAAAAEGIAASLEGWLARHPARPSDPSARRNRSRALEMLGVVAIIRDDKESAAARFRAAVAADSERQAPFVALVGTLAKLERRSEAATLLSRRLERQDRPLFRAMLANTLVRLGRNPEAEEVYARKPAPGARVRAASDVEPEERRAADLGLIAVLLRRAAQTGEKSTAAPRLARAGVILDRIGAETGLDKDEKALLAGLRGARLALLGDRVGALTALASAPEDTSYDDDLKALRAALGVREGG